MVTVWTKDEVAELRKDLDFWTTQVSFHLQYIMRDYASSVLCK